jgi:tRNA(Ile)-lysidine synthase
MSQGGLSDNVLALIDQAGPYEAAPVVCVGVSGGGDSMALVLLLDSWAKTHNGRVIALTVDHQLRAESAHEARQVSDWLRSRGIEHHTLPWRNPVQGSALQETARAARYELMEQWCHNKGVLHLFLAHNAEDQAETFLMRLDKGSGPDGLSAMSVVSERRYCRLARPLLSISRVELRAYLTDNNQDWIEDPSNLDTKFERIRWRQVMANENLSPHGFCQSALRYGRARTILDLEVARLAAMAVFVHPAGFIRINRARFNDAPFEIRARVLARTLLAVGGAQYPPRRSKIDTMLAAIKNTEFKGRTLGQCRIDGTSDDLIVTREGRTLPDPISIDRPGQIMWDHRFRVSVSIPDRENQTRIFLQALGAHSEQQIKNCVDLGHVAGIPYYARLGLPALCDKNGVLSVPHLGFVRTDDAENTQAINAQISDVTFCSLNSLSGSGYFVAN